MGGRAGFTWGPDVIKDRKERPARPGASAGLIQEIASAGKELSVDQQGAVLCMGFQDGSEWEESAYPVRRGSGSPEGYCPWGHKESNTRSN